MPVTRRNVRIAPILFTVLCFSSLFLAACQGIGPISPLLVAEKALTNGSPAAIDAASAAGAVEATVEATPVTTVETTATATVAATATVTATATPVAEEDAPDATWPPSMPVALSIPSLDVEAAVTPMGWEPILQGEQVTTRWVIPLDSLGWAVNSAGAGEEGNVVIAGHQALGAAPLRPLALGDVSVGQEILVETSGGRTYVYRVREVSPPIGAIGATAAEDASAAAYLAPAASAQLTLLTGWPSDVSTHRLFVVADLEGVRP
jgi:sortase (surface protein transpeptidase)